MPPLHRSIMAEHADEAAALLRKAIGHPVSVRFEEIEGVLHTMFDISAPLTRKRSVLDAALRVLQPFMWKRDTGMTFCVYVVSSHPRARPRKRRSARMGRRR